VSEKTGRVLVGCPTYAGKEYSLDPWLTMFKSLTYSPKFAYQVDNTRVSTGYFDLLRSKGIDCTHLTPWPDWDRTFKKCWDLILRRAQELDCYWVYSVEADNIPAPESLEVMVNLALMGNCHLVTHAYPMHASAAQASGIPENSWYYHELGCMLMTRSLLERALKEFEEYGNIAHSIFSTCDRYMGGYIKLTSRFKVDHLDGYAMSFQNLGPSEIPGLICPTAKMPDDFMTELPPSLRGN
jgi:hypothetical protein